MCFSEEASLSSLLVGLFSSFAVFTLPKPEDKVLGLFFAFVSLMQGIDYLLWRHPVCDSYNLTISRAGMWLNHHQPIVLAALILFYFPMTHYKSVITTLIGIYIAMIIPYGLLFYTLPKEKQCTHTGCNNRHIAYSWFPLPGSYVVYIYFLILFFTLPLLGFTDKTIAKAAVLGGGLTWLTTGLFYEQKHFSSVWCFYSAFLPLLYFGARTSSLL